MDFDITEQDEEFRREIVLFVESNLPSRPGRGAGGRLKWKREWATFLAHSGYAMPSWPKKFGGMELSLTQQLIYHETMAIYNAPPHPNVRIGIVGPMLMRYGTEKQRQRFLTPLLRGDELWSQGFSEPDAGSDLSSLKTLAVLDGEEYLVNGRKIWTSGAEKSDWMFTLVRTGPLDSGYKGITYLLIAMNTPGIEIRPILDMTGLATDEQFCDVTLENVRVPVANRLGPEGDGWVIARASLGHERSTNYISRALNYRRILNDLVGLAIDQGVDESLWDELAILESSVRLIRLNGMRRVSEVMRNGEPGPASSADRLSYALFEQRLHEVALRVCGPFAMLSSNEARNLDRGRWVYGFLRTRASTIGAGTAEIQRNTLAERVLGLPSDLAVSSE